ncbi:hypothetical protein [Treponema sp.]|uniref:hypothetical protein n=1 Tax=Treponema sp. TaxID=166 RepID=UPI003F0085F5
MPVKLIGILMLVVLVSLFTGFNLSNRCTIWFFYSFKDIPVFAALFSAFMAGVLITLPFTFKKKDEKKSVAPSEPRGKKRKEKPEQENSSPAQEPDA